MQYIQLQPQLAASVPTPEVGNFNIFVDSVTNVLSFKDNNGSIYQSEALTGGMYNPNNGVLSLTSDSGSINLTGFTNGNIVNGSYSDGVLNLTNQVGEEISISGFSTSSGGNVIDITYADLYSAITDSTLEIGSTYRLTDYKSVNFLNGWNTARTNPTPIDVNFNPREVYVSEEEVLILKAISSNSLEPIAYSEKFKNDKIDFLPYVNKLGLSLDLSNGTILPNDETLNDFDLQWDGTNVYIQMPNDYPVLFGHFFYLYAQFISELDISYYQDGNFEPITPYINECQYPYTSDDVDYGYGKKMSRIQVVNDGYKVILLDLTEDDYNNYSQGSLYVNHVYAVNDAYGWITRRNDTERNINVPFDFRNRKYRRFEVDLSPLGSNFSTDYWLIGDVNTNHGTILTTNGNFKDFKVLQNDGEDAYNLYWEGIGGPDSYWYNGYQDNNVIIRRCGNVAFNDYTYDNTFRYIESTNFSVYINNNLIDTLSNSNLGSNIGNNIINNFYNINIENIFYNNKFNGFFNTSSFGSSYYNNIYSGNFQNNKFANNAQNNQINNARYNVFADNTFSVITNQFSNFEYNNFLVGINNINLTSATHIYSTYQTTITNNSFNQPVLSYIDGNANQLTITSINS
jgi:hypothetical protein